MKYQVRLDNGGGYRGVQPAVFDTRKAAEAFAKKWVADMRSKEEKAMWRWAGAGVSNPTFEVTEVAE